MVKNKLAEINSSAHIGVTLGVTICCSISGEVFNVLPAMRCPK
jgi:hypothetical protein